MSAEPAANLPKPWQPDPVRQRRAGYRLEDLLRLPPDAPRVELLDGVLHVVPAPTLGHQHISGLLRRWLGDHAPRSRSSCRSATSPRKSPSGPGERTGYRPGQSGSPPYARAEEAAQGRPGELA
ncbi:hypothetical protein Pma05_74200 [Plantactinospora mayteni]|uniref:Restriction endonuclease domain-containing protein n=1 Tax=Plantactinospora mayteni TaxID=566021 RepID=A0ABQ4F1Q9_9ACTN|nr:hypothetical protein Pma05_74200 [Plantactinospora mayteni]